MSDFNPSAGAIGKAGDALLNLLDTIGGKLYDAEASTQYNHATQLARQATTQFNEQIQTDPDYKNYTQKTEKFKSSVPQQVNKFLTNPLAQKKFNEWWSNAGDEIDQSVGQRRIKAWGDDLTSTANKDSDSIMNQVASGKITSEDAMQKLGDTWAPLVNNNLISRDAHAKQMDVWKYETRLDEVTHGAFDAMQGSGGVPDFNKLVTFLSDPGKTKGMGEVELNTIRAKGESWYKAWVYDANSGAEQKNSELKMKIIQTAFDKSPTEALRMAVSGTFSDVIGGTKGADEKRAMIDWAEGQIDRGNKGEGKVKSGGSKFYEIMRDTVNPRANLSSIRSTAANLLGVEGGISIEDFNQIKASLDSRENPMIVAWDKLFVPTGDRVLDDRLKEANGLFSAWAAANKDQPPTVLEKEAHRLHQEAVDNHLQSLTSLLYPEETAAAPSLSQQERGAKAAPAPSYPKTITDTLAKNKVSITSARKNDKGTVTYMGSDGRQYRTGTDNTVRWWDGKAWQILK